MTDISKRSAIHVSRPRSASPAPNLRLRFHVTAFARLLRRTVVVVRDEGPIEVGRKAKRWLRRLLAQRRRNAQLGAIADPLLFETFHDPAALGITAPLCGDAGLIQELALPFDRLVLIEILVADAARAARADVEVALLTGRGELLAAQRLPTSGLSDNEFAPIAFRVPLDVPASERLFITFRAHEGRKGVGVRLRTSVQAVDPMWTVSTARSPTAADLADLAAPSAEGGLVLRAHGLLDSQAARYRRIGAERHVGGVASSRAPRLAVFGAVGRGAISNAEVVADMESLRRAVNTCAIDALVLLDVPWSAQLAGVLRAAARRGIPVAASIDSAALTDPPFLPPLDTRASNFSDPHARQVARRRTLLASDFVLATDEALRRFAASYRRDVIEAVDGPVSVEAIAARMIEAHRLRRRPRVSIVTILYNKARELPFVLESYARQSYDGEVELIFVDDCSPDASAAVVVAAVPDSTRGGGRIETKILRNDSNSGNCVSRNRGIAAASGEIVVVVDADCMLGRDFVQRHVDAHGFGDCEIVIGPMNIETDAREPLAVLAELEAAPASALSRSELQDPRHPTSFLNCITRNFSIRRGAIIEPLFDPLFGYSADPASGFGWEDVEMGYRLYKQGARIKFAAEAFSVHVSAPDAYAGTKPARSLLNFRRLLDKHPEFSEVAHSWVRETYARICDWAQETGTEIAEHQAALDPLLTPRRSARVWPRAHRRLRVLTHRWHVPHQYELWKLPLDVTMVTELGTPMSHSWEYGQRPMPLNARFRRFQDIDPRDFDVAILHFDENVLAPENTNGVIGPDWGACFRFLASNVDLPRIAICHGTPQFRGQYNFDYSDADLMQPIEAERQRLVDFLGDATVVCNSYQAQAEWRFNKSRVIWHGFSPAEFPAATYERGILSPIGPLVLSRPHYRGYFLYRQVFEGCIDELRPESIRVPEPHPDYDRNAYAYAKFRLYADELRRYSVYFNPTLRSPMPRARGEAMMCGLVPVSARNHDVERFVTHGVDGFYADGAGELREQLRFLVRNPDAARRIGAAARTKAIEAFHVDRYLDDWRGLVADVVGSDARRPRDRKVAAH